MTVPPSDNQAPVTKVTLPLAADVLALAFATGQEGASGEQVGPYKLRTKIGEGGFGTVWMAEQLEPIRRKVAVKIIKLGMDTEEFIARFEAERQALALMDHPNIARVIDAGATETGRPYFVMELVRGIAITRYADENRLSTEARLRLFVSACRAVEHAHQKGIIHRDLKPSNILVAQDEGAPVPKVIDFGIAKATQGRLTDRTLLTQFHSFLGTPAYASPEQIESSGADVDTRTDIYSLGVLLYELLAGRLPFEAETLARSGVDEMRRTLREVDPPRPSQRLATLSAEERGAVARQRGAEPGKLSLQLRGDLDSIVMHCLEKGPDRRYATVSGLARDVERFLAHEPVTARLPTATYRLGKFIRRHRLGFAAGTAVLVSLVAGLVMLSLMLLRERDARQRETSLRAAADASAREARTAATKSAEVAQFMKNMLTGVAPSAAKGRDATMLREILDATAQKLDTELAGQPAVAADLRDILGGVYRDLGQYAAGEKLLRDNVAIRRKLNGNSSAELAATLEAHAKVLKYLGKPGVKELLLEALAIRQKLFGPKHPLVVHTLAELSYLPDTAFASVDEWEATRRNVLALRLEIYGPEHPDVAESYFSLGTVARQRNDPAEGARLYRQALEIRRKLLGPIHPELTGNLVALGAALNEAQKWSEAAAAFYEAIELGIRIIPEHPRMTAALLQLASGPPSVVCTDANVRLARATIAVQRDHLDPSSPSVGVSMLALALLLDGRPETAAEARPITSEAIAVLESNRRHGTTLDVEIFTEMGRCALSRIRGGAPAPVRVLTEQMLLFARAGLGPSLAASATPLSLSALVHYYAGQPAEACLLWEEGVPLMQKNNAATVPTLTNVAMLGAGYRETGRPADSERLLRDGLAAMTKSLRANAEPDPAVAVMHCELGMALIAQSRFAEAEACLRQSVDNHNRAERENPTRSRLWQQLRPRAEVESGLGEALAGQGRFTEAEPLLTQGFNGLKAQRDTLAGDRDKLLREAADRLVAFYAAWNKPESVAEWRTLRLQIAANTP